MASGITESQRCNAPGGVATRLLLPIRWEPMQNRSLTALWATKEHSLLRAVCRSRNNALSVDRVVSLGHTTAAPGYVVVDGFGSGVAAGDRAL
jgi:hypothetical protein